MSVPGVDSCGAGIYYSILKSLARGCGEINSSVIDLYKWDKALVGCRLFSEDTLTQMFSAKGGYACGVFAGGSSVMHGGSTDVFNSYNAIYTGDGLYIIVLINKPIEEFSSTTIAGNIRKFWTGGI